MRRNFIALLVALFSSCKSVTPRSSDIDHLHPWLLEGKRPKVGLVLSGGASKGFAHVGVIRALEQEKIPVDFIVGTSVGSLIGALYAVSKNSFELEWMAFDLKKEDLFDFTILSPTQGYVKGEQLVQFIRQKVGSINLEQMKIPLHVTATDLQTGELVIFSSGPVENAVRASASIPVLFPPALIDNRQLVDGGVVNNIPIDVAREKGADIVIAVDISETVTNRNLTNVADYAMQSISIMMSLNSRSQLKDADIVIRPKVGNVGIWDFTKKKELMSAGIAATKENLPQIRDAFKKWIEKNVH